MTIPDRENLLKGGIPYDEHAVLKRLAKGSITAFDEIYTRYSPIVYREAYRLLRSPEATKDLVQDVFATVWDKRTNFTAVEHFRAYLVKMSKNLAYQHFLRLSREVVAKDELLRVSNAQSNDTEQVVHLKDLEVLLEETVDLLPRRQQEVYRLSKNRGLNYEAIAQHLSISPNTVKNHLIAAKDFIRERLRHAVLLLLSFFMSL